MRARCARIEAEPISLRHAVARAFSAIEVRHLCLQFGIAASSAESRYGR